MGHCHTGGEGIGGGDYKTGGGIYAISGRHVDKDSRGSGFNLDDKLGHWDCGGVGID
jgi:hypothetical protein